MTALENFFSEWVKKNKPYRTTNQYSGEDMMLFGKVYAKKQNKELIEHVKWVHKQLSDRKSLCNAGLDDIDKRTEQLLKEIR